MAQKKMLYETVRLIPNSSRPISERGLNLITPKTRYKNSNFKEKLQYACFGVPRLISAAWYTSRYVTSPYLYAWACSLHRI
jgi:hypothetical protein